MKRLYVLLSLLIGVLPTIAKASSENNNKITFYGGQEYLYYYEILANSDGTKTHTNEVRGNLPGAGVTFSKLFFNRINLVFDASRFSGSPESSNVEGHFYIPQSITDVNMRLEYQIPLNRFMVIPFGQVGYRYWHRSVQGITVSQYSEYYYTNYYAVGLRFKIDITPKLNIISYYGIGSTFNPRMRTSAVTLNDSDGFFYIPPGGTHLGSEAYELFGFDLNYQITDHFEWYLGYEQTTFGFGQGIHNTILEPSSKTMQRIYKTGLTYSF
jgi:hypothetical protein